MNESLKVLQLCAVPVTARFLLRPLIDRLSKEGCEVHVACSGGLHATALTDDGICLHEIEISRSFLTLKHLRSIWQLFRLMRRERYTVVHAHTPVAAALGRIAARLARVPNVVYTAHGFYFHEGMNPWVRRPIVWIERWLGRRATDVLFTQSQEDLDTALHERIHEPDSAYWIGNGVDVQRLAAEASAKRSDWGISEDDIVVGFVGRFVREKGLLELLDAVSELRSQHDHMKLLLVGGEITGDRGSAIGETLSEWLAARGIEDITIVTGFQENVAPFYGLMDAFVLPSHREGMPRTILEAMACGLPVVASEIRGCREEVVDGVTGSLFPVRDVNALTACLDQLVRDSEMRLRFGAAGQELARAAFEEEFVLQRQLDAFAAQIPNWPGTPPQDHECCQASGIEDMLGRIMKRVLDLLVACLGLVLLGIPFLAIALAIKLDDGGPVFFRQERVGRNQKTFRVWKFRTMVLDASRKGLGHTVSSEDDRITRVGKRLRSWGVDELPQLLNVLAGEMSLVGPRPTLSYQVEHYTPFQLRRLGAKPGITSLAVVSGRNALSWEARIRLDVRYIEEWTFGLDLLILLRTLWCVLVTKRGLYGEDGINDPFVSPPSEDE